MKRYLFVLAFALFSTYAAQASVLKICATMANEVCQELRGEDFLVCHRFQMDLCLDDRYATFGYEKSMCHEYCSTLPETTMRELCYQRCQE